MEKEMEFQDNKTESTKEIRTLFGEKTRLMKSLYYVEKSISRALSSQKKLENNVKHKMSDQEFMTVLKITMQRNILATKAFREAEKMFNKSEGWTESVINYTAIESQLKRVVDQLKEEGNNELKLLEKYKLFNKTYVKSKGKIGSIVVSYWRAFNLAVNLETKDKLSAELESNLKDKQKDIESLKQDLKKSLSLSVEERVLALSKLEPSLSYVQLGKCLGISRQKVSRVINDDSQKEQTQLMKH
jgi:hypothetical protein